MNKTKSVLVVEDEDEIRSLIVSSLKEQAEGLDLIIVEAKDGREAINFSGRQEFHCIVTDLNMPRTTGDELIRVLLADTLNANTPMIVVSGNISDEFLQTYKNVRVVAKPFEPLALSQLVLREIKLGRIDERIPIHLLNPVLESLQRMFHDDIKMRPKFSVHPAAARKSGEPILGDFHATFTLTTGMTQARIGLTFQRDWLHWWRNEYFSARRDQWASMSAELTARQTALAIIEKAQTQLAAIMGAAPRVAELSVVDLGDALRAAEASKTPGIVMGFSTDQGQVLATALSPLKVKRAVA
ncbi:MAG: response regulator [Proteobacteria bacterium]|nr:MAG: response regulator [Pseudomonadota bacterium]